jgi:HlyD family secretion protein
MTQRRLLAAAAAVLLVALAAWRLSRPSAGPRYETVPADRGDIVARVTASGTLSALVTVQVGSQVSGRIQSVLVDFNSRVKKGQLIARIDPQLFDAAVEQARANLMAANGNAEKAKAQAIDATRQAQRSRALADQKLVAVADAETAEAAADAARASVAAAEGSVAQARAALNQAQVNFGYTNIVSPIDGVVISRNVDPGQTVAASLQVATLFTIAEDLARMQVDTSVSEADVGKLVDGMEVSFTVDAFPGEKFVGRVRQVRNAATTVQNVVTYDAVIDVANPELKLRPGMTANATFVWAERKGVVRIPNAALRFQPPAELLAGLGRKEKGAGAGAAPNGPAPSSSGAPGAPGGKGGPPAAGAGAEGGARDDKHAASRRTAWVLKDGVPRPVRLRVGVTDGSLTELVDGELAPGDACVVDMDGKPGGGPAGSNRPPRMF